MNQRVLLVEDGLDIRNLVHFHLQDAGYQVDIAADGATAWAKTQNSHYDLIILDIMLPEMDGIEVCQRMRQRGDQTPILMLTARSSEMDRVVGLEVGADDYLTKPFGIKELLARVKALLRRAEMINNKPNIQQDVITHLGLQIDCSKHTVSLGGRPIELTAKEFDLLVYFAKNPGKVFTRIQLLDQVWGYSHEGYEHTVNSHINRLRGKIEIDPANPSYILTVWGVGYKFSELTAN